MPSGFRSSSAGVLLGALAMGIAVRHFAERPDLNMAVLLKTLVLLRCTLWQLDGHPAVLLTLVGPLMGWWRAAPAVADP